MIAAATRNTVESASRERARVAVADRRGQALDRAGFDAARGQRAGGRPAAAGELVGRAGR